MISALLVVFFILLFAYIIRSLIVPMYYTRTAHMDLYDDVDDEIVTTTTTTTTTTVTETTPEYDIVGELTRQHDGGPQSWVIDPADQARIYVSNADDMYQDADGKIWRLV